MTDPRTQLLTDIAGLGDALCRSSLIARLSDEAKARQDAAKRLFVIKAQLDEKFAALEPLARKTAEAGYALARDLREIA
jgi:hypothetical protein